MQSRPYVFNPYAGVRFSNDSRGDQVRVTTPAKAKELGSDFIVVGRLLPQQAIQSPLTFAAKMNFSVKEQKMNLNEQIAKDLLRIQAVFFRPDQPFTWASGIKSPVYCDNRLTLTAPEVRTDVENGLAALIRMHYPNAEVLMGTSTAGIAHAAITAHILELPMGYVRSGAKDHGRQNRIEGKLEAGQKVVVVEDLISTGGSVIEVVERSVKQAQMYSASSAFLPTACKKA